MKIRYTSDIKAIDLKKLNDWKNGDGEKHEKKWFEKLLKNAAFVIGAFDGDKMVGFVRTFGDGMVWLMIVGLYVHPDYRKQGIAKEMMSRIIRFAKKNKYQTVRLFAATDEDPGLKKFYKKMKYEPMDNAMRSEEMEW